MADLGKNRLGGNLHRDTFKVYPVPESGTYAPEFFTMQKQYRCKPTLIEKDQLVVVKFDGEGFTVGLYDASRTFIRAFELEELP